jgi:hypothetical protein
MKVRVIQKENGYFEPQYQKDGKFGSMWCEIPADGNGIYETMKSAIEVCEEWKADHKESNVVWEG